MQDQPLTAVRQPAQGAFDLPRAEAVLGVPLALTTYDGARDWIDAAVAAGERGYVCVAAVHTVMACQDDHELRAAVEGASFTVPDGQPLVWALNALGHSLPDRVYGPELMDRMCAHAARTGLRFYLYGGRNQGGLAQLARNLRLRHPGLRIVGGYSPPFRPQTEEEEVRVAAEINRSGADVVWVGIGVPKQEKWMARMRDRLDAPPSTSTRASSRRRPTRSSGSAWSGPSGSARSRAGCGGATCVTTRGSWRGSPGSTSGTSSRCAAASL
jgi:exopolysaccharide biosynthesis WecB/TagA/CpsF family protein